MYIVNNKYRLFKLYAHFKNHTESEVAGVDEENFPAFFVTLEVSDITPQLLDDLAVISQLFNLLFNQWITSKYIKMN